MTLMNIVSINFKSLKKKIGLPIKQKFFKLFFNWVKYINIIFLKFWLQIFIIFYLNFVVSGWFIYEDLFYIFKFSLYELKPMNI